MTAIDARCGDRRVARARGERGERIAKGGLAGFLVAAMPVGEVDETALLVEMLQRMQQRALPPGEERGREDDPCETGQHAAILSTSPGIPPSRR